MAFLLRLLKWLGLLVLSIILLYAIGRPTQIWLDGFYSGTRAPYLQMTSPHAVTLRWQSSEKIIGVVRYGIKMDQLKNINSETKANEEHELRLTNLKPATKYFYSVGSKTAENFKGKDFWFKTAPITKANNNSPVRFWVTGDQGYPSVIQNQVRDAALNWAKQHSRTSTNNELFDFWITTGDNAYRSGSNEQFQLGFLNRIKLFYETRQYGQRMAIMMHGAGCFLIFLHFQQKLKVAVRHL